MNTIDFNGRFFGASMLMSGLKTQFLGIGSYDNLRKPLVGFRDGYLVLYDRNNPVARSKYELGEKLQVSCDGKLVKDFHVKITQIRCQRLHVFWEVDILKEGVCISTYEPTEYFILDNYSHRPKYFEDARIAFKYLIDQCYGEDLHVYDQNPYVFVYDLKEVII